MKLESCFNCLELESLIEDENFYYCPVWAKEVFDPTNTGCEYAKLPAKFRKNRRNQKYVDEELGIWYVGGERIYPPKPDLPFED